MSKSYRGSRSASYHPAVLLSLLVYGYATGVFSSRKLERPTYESVAFSTVVSMGGRTVSPGRPTRSLRCGGCKRWRMPQGGSSAAIRDGRTPQRRSARSRISRRRVGSTRDAVLSYWDLMRRRYDRLGWADLPESDLMRFHTRICFTQPASTHVCSRRCVSVTGSSRSRLRCRLSSASDRSVPP
jgi:hypothetical protein